MFRSPDLRHAALVVALVGSVTLGAAASAVAAPAAPTPPPAGTRGAIEDLVLIVESLDQTVSELRQGNQIKVALVSDVLFDLGKSEVKPPARHRLEEVAGQIREKAAGGVVQVDGHTDDQGADGYNQELSTRRANAVKDVLAQLLSGANVTLETRGYGESRPTLPNDSKENRMRNRRVEITFGARS